MVADRCDACKFYLPYNRTSGACRISPPAVNISRGPGSNNSVWPDVKADDWCGEYLKAK